MAAIHIIKCRFKLAGETSYYWIERGEDRTDFQSTVDDILSGQIEPENIVLILEVDSDLGTVRDVTEDVARECYQQHDRYTGIRWELLSFLQANGAAPIHWVA